jgi:triosephosphate isomerase
MNKTSQEAEDLVKGLVAALGDYDQVETVIAPPFPYLVQTKKLVEGSSNVLLAAQNMFWEEKGAYTGEVSPSMLVDIGCDYVILGHSERRQYFGETDEGINRKVHSALKFGLKPLVCVGEVLEQRKSGQAERVVEAQLVGCLQDVDAAQMGVLVIAYEPVWAIGTGETATPQQAQEVHAFIRRTLAALYDDDVAQGVRIQYGGSVKPENIRDLMGQADVDGALVGGASLKKDAFVSIVTYGSE